MVDEVSANQKVLNWLPPDEREICVRCGERARVDLPALGSWVCFGCGASSVGRVEPR